MMLTPPPKRIGFSLSLFLVAKKGVKPAYYYCLFAVEGIVVGGLLIAVMRHAFSRNLPRKCLPRRHVG